MCMTAISGNYSQRQVIEGYKFLMDSEQKKKYEELKIRAQLKMQEQRLQKNVLLQECLSALNSYRIIEDEAEAERIAGMASSQDAEMHSHDDLIVLNMEEQYFIVWDEATLPIVLCSGKSIKECWDDVMAVAFDTYLVSESTGKVIGIRH